MKNTWYKTLSISLMAFAVMTFSGNGAMAQEAGAGILPSAPLTSVQAVATNNIVFTKANYNIIFNTATAGAVKRLDITFPASFNLTNAKLIEVDKIGAGSLTRAGLTFTYTVAAGTAPVIAAGTRIRIMIGDIVNNGNAGAQSVSVTSKDNQNVIIDGPTASTNPGLVKVTAVMIADGGVTTAKIAANAVDGTKIAPAAVGPGQISNGAIQSNHILDGTVGTSDLADGAVTDAKITGPVSGAKINTIGLDADTVDGKHAADLQNRVTGVCAAGSSIRTVNVDGTVVCEANSNSSGIFNQLETTGNLTLPLTTSSTGIIKSGNNTLIHSYGTGNFFAGTNAGNLTMTGNSNTAAGEKSLYSNTTGYFNTAIGINSLYQNTDGYYNTAIGALALDSQTWGHGNTALGFNAGKYIDVYNACSTIYSNSNTFIGANTLIEAYPNLTLPCHFYNSTAIGYGASIYKSNTVRIGNDFIQSIEASVNITVLSDARKKKEIHETSLGLDFITKLKPVEYKMIDGDDRINLGFLAQDIETTLGNNYSILGIGRDKDSTLSLRYTDFIAPLVKAVQELRTQKEAEVAGLKEDIKRQAEEKEHEIAELKAQISELQKQLAVVMAAINGDKHKLLAELDAENLNNEQ